MRTNADHRHIGVVRRVALVLAIAACGGAAEQPVPVQHTRVAVVNQTTAIIGVGVYRWADDPQPPRWADPQEVQPLVTGLSPWGIARDLIVGDIYIGQASTAWFAIQAPDRQAWYVIPHPVHLNRGRANTLAIRSPTATSGTDNSVGGR